VLDGISFHSGATDPTALTVLYTFLLSFVLSAAIGITYVKTFRGLSYSQGFVQAMILSSLVSATVIQAIGDSLARGIGMLGALAIVRFRTNFKDARDIIFMFAALASGIACGVQGYAIAVIGTLFFILVSGVLYFTHLGKPSYFDGMLRFNMENTDESRGQLELVLREHCKVFALVILREAQQGQRLDYAYHIKLKKNKTAEALLARLQRELTSIQGVSLMLQEATIEL
jgi:uncharacterized membrane protein YhiD involved in acid resistance